ncbi:MAG: T9SS C-terminal target domain-containing protein [Balneolaceae bacterium]|nr:MAG: T9SS C-terminal target domain-containing protein [Balneolaceae bacterium]
MRLDFTNAACLHRGRTILFIFFISVICPIQFAAAQNLHLNEVMASNNATITDADGDAGDWIEITNSGEESLNLQDYGLSDDYSRPFRWRFPEITIQPGDFLLIWATGKDRTDPSGELHTNFSISAAGEEVILTSPDGIRIDELPPTAIPTDISFGRYPDGTGDWYYFKNPTPGGPNSPDGYQELLEPVTFSHAGGFSAGSFELQLTHPDQEVTIIYTLDGSVPDPANLDGRTYSYMDRYLTSARELQDRTYTSLVYDSAKPIQISDRSAEPNYLSRMQSVTTSNPEPDFYPSTSIFKGTVVRAVAVKAGSLPAGIQTHSYFVTPVVRNRYSLPVISLAIQEDHLFGYEEGIYVPGILFDQENTQQDTWGPHNYRARGIEWERPASLEIFEKESVTAGLKQDIGVRIHGGWTRSLPMKSLRLYARNEYGDSRFFYRMFPDQPYEAYNRLLLRNSGNDWGHTMFRDAALQAIVGHMKFDTQAYRPFVVFINGEYWGIQNMRERYDRHYLARVYGVDPDNLDYLSAVWLAVTEGDNRHYVETRNYIRDNIAPGQTANNEQHYEYIKTRIDPENFIDYHIAQIYIANTDWPQGNIDFWRTRNSYNPGAPYGHDGRWRWLMYDTDHGFNLYGHNPASFNSIAFATATGGTQWPNPDGSTLMLRKLLEIESFRTAFLNRYADQLNTAFQPARVHSVLDSLSRVIIHEIPEHNQRWARSGWQVQYNWMLAFASDRPHHAREHLKGHFGIAALHELQVDISDSKAGRVQVNTIEISPETPGVDTDPWPWRGVYFDGIPISLKAIPMPGYVFSHWEGVAKNREAPEVELPMKKSESVTAVFYPEPDPDLFPRPWSLHSDGRYVFNDWPADAPTGEYPDNMAFVYMDDRDPGLSAIVAGFTDGPYDYADRTRITGLGAGGFAFINTGNEEGNPGYPGTRLGGAILALNTLKSKNIEVTWVGQTVEPNSRIYNIRLQYRIGNDGPFGDIPDSGGNPMEYTRNEFPGHHERIGPVRLPETMENRAYVQLFWRYYHTGEQADPGSGQRSMLAVSGIDILAQEVLDVDDNPEIPGGYLLEQNYPNPFNPVTVIGYHLPKSTGVTISVFDILGRGVATLVDDRMPAGRHEVRFDASRLPSGVYIFQLQSGEFVQTRKMLLVK